MQNVSIDKNCSENSWLSCVNLNSSEIGFGSQLEQLINWFSLNQI